MTDVLNITDRDNKSTKKPGCLVWQDEIIFVETKRTIY
jgi:hypothetical protein